jgi:hypothetical protein
VIIIENKFDHISLWEDRNPLYANNFRKNVYISSLLITVKI